MNTSPVQFTACITTICDTSVSVPAAYVPDSWLFYTVSIDNHYYYAISPPDNSIFFSLTINEQVVYWPGPSTGLSLVSINYIKQGTRKILLGTDELLFQKANFIMLADFRFLSNAKNIYNSAPCTYSVGVRQSTKTCIRCPKPNYLLDSRECVAQCPKDHFHAVYQLANWCQGK